MRFLRTGSAALLCSASCFGLGMLGQHSKTLYRHLTSVRACERASMREGLPVCVFCVCVCICLLLCLCVGFCVLVWFLCEQSLSASVCVLRLVKGGTKLVWNTNNYTFQIAKTRTPSTPSIGDAQSASCSATCSSEPVSCSAELVSCSAVVLL